MRLRTAVVGAGVVSSTHLSGLSRNPRTELVAVCDLDEERVREAATTHGIEPYTGLDDLLTSESLDWVHICTPVETHLDLATRVLEAGVPVLIEKPVAGTVTEVEELIETADRCGLRASVVHNLLYTPAMQKARRAISRNHLGTLRGVDLVYTDMTRPDEPKRGSWTFDLPGGEFEEGLPHPIYTVLEVGGFPSGTDDISTTTALRGEYDHEFSFDEFGFQYVTDDGTICSATMRAGGIPQRFLTIHGENASLLVDLLSQTVIDLGRDYTGSPARRAMNNVDHVIGRVKGTADGLALVGRKKLSDDWDDQKASNSHYFLFDREVDAIRDGSDESNGLERARWVMEILEASHDAPQQNVGTE